MKLFLLLREDFGIKHEHVKECVTVFAYLCIQWRVWMSCKTAL